MRQTPPLIPFRVDGGSDIAETRFSAAAECSGVQVGVCIIPAEDVSTLHHKKSIAKVNGDKILQGHSANVPKIETWP